MSKLFELAQNRKEAEELAAAGFGYETRTAAEKARKSPEIDSYYRDLIKVYEVTVPDSTQEK
jgi:hypothetical protein